MDQKITIRLSDDLYDNIKRNAKALNKNISETIRLELEMMRNCKMYIENNTIYWTGSRPIE